MRRTVSRTSAAVVAAFSAAVVLFSANAAYAQQEPLLEASKQICIATHANNAKALALADKAGWQAPPEPDLADTRDKSTGGLNLMLVVGQDQSSEAFGQEYTNYCTIFADPGSANVLELVSTYMARPPMRHSDNHWEWVFAWSGETKIFLTDGRPKARSAAMDKYGAIVSVLVTVTIDGCSIVYLESAKSRR